MSSFGSPGARQIVAKPIPPERGSFPLDHDAECQPLMKEYLQCLRRARGVNSAECRGWSRGYLQCRMERNLMAPDSMKNLGFHDEGEAGPESALKSSATSSQQLQPQQQQQQQQPASEPEK